MTVRMELPARIRERFHSEMREFSTELREQLVRRSTSEHFAWVACGRFVWHCVYPLVLPQVPRVHESACHAVGGRPRPPVDGTGASARRVRAKRSNPGEQVAVGRHACRKSMWA